MVSLHLKALIMLLCLKRLVIFLICGDVYVNVVHLVLCHLPIIPVFQNLLL
jgi:hypothetical protein